jgi:hypothetical protein
MKEVPKKDLPGVSGGMTTSDGTVPTSPAFPYPQDPIPGPTDQADPFREAY